MYSIANRMTDKSQNQLWGITTEVKKKKLKKNNNKKPPHITNTNKCQFKREVTQHFHKTIVRMLPHLLASVCFKHFTFKMIASHSFHLLKV